MINIITIKTYGGCKQMSEIVNKPTIISILNILSKVKKDISNSRTKTIYMTAHPDLLKDLLCDPYLDSFIGIQDILNRDSLEYALGIQIFEETEMNRNKIKIYYKVDVILDGENND